MAWYDYIPSPALQVGRWAAGNKELLVGSQGDPNRNRWEDRDYIRTTAQQGIAGAQGRPAPQMQGAQVGGVRQMNTGQSDQFRGQQMSLADNLRGIMSGEQQGAGEMAVQRQAQRAVGNAAGAATMARGNSAVGGARAAARASGAIGLGAAGQAQQAAMGDQQSARAQLAGVLGQGREQDIGIAGQNMSAENQRIFQQAGLDQATSTENMRARLQSIGMNDAAIANYLQSLGLMNASEQGARGQDNGILGGLLQAAGPIAAAAMSDERLKTDVEDASEAVDDLLDGLSPWTYRYKDERHGTGRRVGIMAQELQSSEAGRLLVTETPDGLAVDLNAAVTALLATVARLNQRLRELEGR